MTPGSEQGFLHQIFRPLPIPTGQPDGVREQSIPMLILQSAKQFGVLVFQAVLPRTSHIALRARPGRGSNAVQAVAASPVERASATDRAAEVSFARTTRAEVSISAAGRAQASTSRRSMSRSATT